MSYAKKLPRGLRNNNPLNIRTSKCMWNGQIGADDDGFCVFADRRFGYRAAFKILITYKLKYGIYRVEDIIRRWAPSNENNTEAYIKAVCNYTGFERDQTILLKENKISLVRAMAKVELGIKWAYFIFTPEIEWGYERANNSSIEPSE